MGRALNLGVALGAALVLGSAVPAAADDVTPAPVPTQSATISPPSQQQIDDARSALDRLRNGGATTPAALTQIVEPVAPARRRPSLPRISDQDWWTIGAGALVLLVLSEGTRLGVRRAKHRRRA